MQEQPLGSVHNHCVVVVGTGFSVNVDCLGVLSCSEPHAKACTSVFGAAV